MILDSMFSNFMISDMEVVDLLMGLRVEDLVCLVGLEVIERLALRCP